MKARQETLEISPRDPGVVRLKIKAAKARRVTSLTWVPPPPGKQVIYSWGIGTTQASKRFDCLLFHELLQIYKYIQFQPLNVHPW